MKRRKLPRLNFGFTDTPPGKLWLASVLIALFLLALCIVPIQKLSYRDIVVELTATGENGQGSPSNEVWLKSVTVNGEDFLAKQFVYGDTQWKEHPSDDTLLGVHTDMPSTVSLQFHNTNSVTINILKYGLGGMVEISQNGKSQKIDTYGTAGELKFPLGSVAPFVVNLLLFFVVFLAISYVLVLFVDRKIKLDYQLKFSPFFKKVLYHPLTWIMLVCITYRLLLFSGLEAYTVGPDTRSYWGALDDILEGRIDLVRTPIYPLFLQLGKILFGELHANFAIATIQTVIALVCLPLLYFTLNKIIKNKLFVCIATMLFGVLPQVVNFEKVIMTESLAVSGTIVMFYLLIRYLRSPSHKIAVVIAVWCLLLIMLRPSFLYFLVILALFWLFQYLFEKKNRRMAISGFASLLCCVVLIQCYCLVNEKQNSYNGISNVGSNYNQLYILIEQNLYDNPDFDIGSEIANLKIDAELNGDIDNGHAVWNQMIQININNPPAEVSAYVSSTLKYHFKEYVHYTINKFTLWCNNQISITDYAVPINESFRVFLNNLKTLLFPASFLHIFVMVFFEAVYLVLQWVKLKSIPWVSLGLVTFIIGQLCTSIIGAQSDYQRLIVNIFPMIIALVFYQLDRFLQWYNNFYNKQALEIAVEADKSEVYKS